MKTGLITIGLSLWFLSACIAFANIPGGGTGVGPPVVLIFNTNANPPTVTMSNGIVTAVIDTYSSQILQLTYNGDQLTGGGTSSTSDINWLSPSRPAIFNPLFP